MFCKATRLFLLISVLCAVYVKSEVVCSEDELVREIIEDLEDNGKLDCLRESNPTPDEKPEQKAKRRKSAASLLCRRSLQEKRVKENDAPHN